MSSPVFTRSRETPRAIRELPQDWRRSELETPWSTIAVTSVTVAAAGYILLILYFTLTGGK